MPTENNIPNLEEYASGMQNHEVPEYSMQSEKPFNGQFPVHMNVNEIEELSRAQGGIDTNNELGVPQFLKLGEMVSQNPELKEFIAEAIRSYMESDSDERKKVGNKFDEIAESTLGDEPRYSPSDLNEDPIANTLASLGTDGDNQIALMPENIFELIWENSTDHFRKVNKNTGLPEFAWYDWIGKIIGGAVGLGVGILTANPVLGLSIGTGIGSLGQDLIEGKKDFVDSLLDAGISGLGAYGLGSLGEGAVAGFGNAGFSGALQGLKSSGTELLANPYMAVGLPTLFGLKSQSQQEQINKQNKSLEEKHREDVLKYNNEQIGYSEDAEKRRNAMLGIGISDGQTGHHALNHGYKSFRPMSALQNYAEGGEVRSRMNNIIDDSMFIDGYDDGVADKLKVKIRRGSHMVPAKIISKLGNGNSKAGAKALAQVLEKLSVFEPDDNDFIDAAISSGEFNIHPKHVKAFGHGILDKGHDVLRDMLAKIDNFDERVV